jgi:hypothetical protein
VRAIATSCPGVRDRALQKLADLWSVSASTSAFASPERLQIAADRTQTARRSRPIERGANPTTYAGFLGSRLAPG